MAGRFEIFKDDGGDSGFRFHLTDEEGTIVAVSRNFQHLKAVVAGITAVRENAATGFIVDRTHGSLTA